MRGSGGRGREDRHCAGRGALRPEDGAGAAAARGHHHPHRHRNIDIDIVFANSIQMVSILILFASNPAEKRPYIDRNNVIKLWTFVTEDLKRLGGKKLCPGIDTGAVNHVSIRKLQLLLLKLCLLLGVTVRHRAALAEGKTCIWSKSNFKVSLNLFYALTGRVGQDPGNVPLSVRARRGGAGVAGGDQRAGRGGAPTPGRHRHLRHREGRSVARL